MNIFPGTILSEANFRVVEKIFLSGVRRASSGISFKGVLSFQFGEKNRYACGQCAADAAYPSGGMEQTESQTLP